MIVNVKIRYSCWGFQPAFFNIYLSIRLQHYLQLFTIYLKGLIIGDYEKLFTVNGLYWLFSEIWMWGFLRCL